jgi:hypothetical protein
MADDIPEQKLISEIEAYCAKHEITPTDFGRLAMNDTALVTTLRRGRELRSATRQKILDYLKPGDVAAE